MQTNRGTWLAHNVVIATGYSDRPLRTAAQARHLSPRIVQIVPTQYRNAGQLPPGGALVVGASATGVQLADEIHATGRPVTLAVGRHLRLPRTYRGRDIMWWLDAMGVFDEAVDGIFDVRTSRQPAVAAALVRSGAPSLDVARLRAAWRPGARQADRRERRARVLRRRSDRDAAASDIKLAEMRLRIDAFIARGAAEHRRLPEPFEPTWTSAVRLTKTAVDLKAAGIDTVVWATGFTRRYPWLRVPVLDAEGEIRQRGGITPVPGLFVLGMHFQRRRKSAFIDGVGGDAEFLADHIARRARSMCTRRAGTRRLPWTAASTR